MDLPTSHPKAGVFFNVLSFIYMRNLAFRRPPGHRGFWCSGCRKIFPHLARSNKVYTTSLHPETVGEPLIICSICIAAVEYPGEDLCDQQKYEQVESKEFAGMLPSVEVFSFQNAVKCFQMICRRYNAFNGDL